MLGEGKRGAHVCEGLKGPQYAGDDTGEGCACPYLCGAQTGLGAGVPGPPNRNIGTATTVTHRAEKQRLLECFIMEHSLTATNTFSNNDVRNTNIYTCNYNGCHQPQQIDYILLSDHSLRSRTFDSSATSSDHWGLTATIRERHGKAMGKRHIRKPIGWECNDHITFNNTAHAVKWEQWPFWSGVAAL